MVAALRFANDAWRKNACRTLKVRPARDVVFVGRRLQVRRGAPSTRSGLRPPRRRQHELVLLLGNQWPDFGGKGHEVRIAVDPGPKGAAVGIVVKLPDVDQLVQGPHISCEIAYQHLRQGSDGRGQDSKHSQTPSLRGNKRFL